MKLNKKLLVLLLAVATTGALNAKGGGFGHGGGYHGGGHGNWGHGGYNHYHGGGYYHNGWNGWGTTGAVLGGVALGTAIGAASSRNDGGDTVINNYYND